MKKVVTIKNFKKYLEISLNTLKLFSFTIKEVPSPYSLSKTLLELKKSY